MSRTIAVVTRYYHPDGRELDQPFELCVQLVSDDGDTRLDHDDFALSKSELEALRASIDEHLD